MHLQPQAYNTRSREDNSMVMKDEEEEEEENVWLAVAGGIKSLRFSSIFPCSKGRKHTGLYRIVNISARYCTFRDVVIGVVTREQHGYKFLL